MYLSVHVCKWKNEGGKTNPVVKVEHTESGHEILQKWHLRWPTQPPFLCQILHVGELAQAGGLYRLQSQPVKWNLIDKKCKNCIK